MRIIKIIKKPHTFLSKLFLSFSLTIAITIFILSSFLYLSFEKIGLTIINSYIKDSLSQVSYSTTLMSESAKSLALQIYFDPTISLLTYYYEPNAQEKASATNRLGSFSKTAPFIHSIYVYETKREVFYTSLFFLSSIDIKRPAFFDKGFLDILDHLVDYKRLTPIPRNIPNLYPEFVKGDFSSVYSFIFYDLPEESKVLDNRIIVMNLSEEWMRKIVDSMDTEPQSNIFIVDNGGKTVISNEQHTMLTDLSDKKYIKDILSSSEKSGYFIADVDHVKSLVTYVSSELYGWKFIRITPYDVVVSKIEKAKVRTFLLGFIILAGGLLISIAISRRLFNPLKPVFAKLASFQMENIGKMKQDFLKDLLHSHSEYSIELIQKRADELQLQLDPTQPFFLMIVKIDHYKDFCGKFGLTHRNAMKQALLPTLSKVCSEGFKHEILEAQDDHFVIFFNTQEPFSTDFVSRTDLLSRNIQASASAQANLSLSVTISTMGTSLSQTKDLYIEALEASAYKLIYGHGCIIYTEQIKDLVEREYSYSQEKDKLLIDALMLGKTTDAKQLYTQIVSNAAGSSCNILNSVLLRLAVDINMAVDSIQRNSGLSIPFHLRDFIQEMEDLETLDDFNERFFLLFEEITPRFEEGKGLKYEGLISKVTEMINAEYTDQNLSVYSIAAAMDMSPAYLGRVFKKHTTRSVADHINHVRIEQAKKLLQETSHSIQDIVEQTGFLSSGYFYTLFKKTTGITPNQFRQNRSGS